MNSVLDEVRNEGIEQARVQFAEDMIEHGGFSLELIAELSRLTIDRVKELAAQKALQ